MLFLFTAIGVSPADAGSGADLDAAFLAAFGGMPPMTRHVEEPLHDRQHPERTGAREPLTMSLTPDRLVPLGGSRWALVVSETAENANLATPGAIGVAYLRHVGDAWVLEQLWPEVGYLGIDGRPGRAGEEVRRFAASPLYFATDESCGLGECSDGITAISLDVAAPRLLGTISGGAVNPAIRDALDLGCEHYDFTARIGPPSTANGLFSVTYRGWTAPDGKTAPRSRFRLVTDAVSTDGSLAAWPAVKIPDCAR